VLGDSDPAEAVAIAAGLERHICEAGLSLERAAIRDLGDPGGVIELEVPLLVEGFVADWRRGNAWLLARRDLEVNVEVLSAPLFLFAADTATVIREDLCTVHVALIHHCISKEILARFWAWRVVINLRGVVLEGWSPDNCWPHTVIINLEADGVAVLVVGLTSLIDARLTAALGEKLLLGVVVEEDVDIAFDLLGCRPINLAILLQALLLKDMPLILGRAVRIAILILDVADCIVASILLAHALLEALLGRIARHVSCEECMVGNLALTVQLRPLRISRLVLLDHSLQPAAVA